MMTTVTSECLQRSSTGVGESRMRSLDDALELPAAILSLTTWMYSHWEPSLQP